MATSKKNLIVAVLSLLVASLDSQAKEWRGIVPLHSTREDVARLFNQCRDPKMDCVFQLGNEDIRIVFSGAATGDFPECPSQLPAGTVLLIATTPKTNLPLKRLRINKTKLRSFDPSSPPNSGYVGYIDDKEGLLLKTYKGRVLEIHYIAMANDKPLCPSYYENPESLIQVGLFTHCPPISLVCPTNSLAGAHVTCSAETDVDPKTRFTWRVTDGRIVNGQGTRVISLDTKGLEGKTITVMVGIGGFCSTTAASAVRILPK